MHCCRPVATQSLAYEKLSRIGYFDLIFCENGGNNPFFACNIRDIAFYQPFRRYKNLFIFTFHFSVLRWAERSRSTNLVSISSDS